MWGKRKQVFQHVKFHTRAQKIVKYSFFIFKGLKLAGIIQDYSLSLKFFSKPSLKKQKLKLTKKMLKETAFKYK